MTEKGGDGLTHEERVAADRTRRELARLGQNAGGEKPESQRVVGVQTESWRQGKERPPQDPNADLGDLRRKY